MKKHIDQIIDDALKSEPDFRLNQDFRNSVFKAIRRKEATFQRKIYFLIGLGVICMIAAGMVSIAYFIPGLDLTALKGSSQGGESLVPIAILIGVMLVVIQFLDMKLIKDRYLSH